MGLGNIIGKPNEPNDHKASGIWTLDEQRNAVRANKWPYAVISKGLLYNLDAGNNSSYPGTGTTWTNLVDGTGVTLTNVTYTSDIGGGLTFGSTSYGSIPSGLNFSGGGFTVSVLIKHTGTVSTGRIQRYITWASTPSGGPVLRHDTSSASSLHAYIFDSGNTFRTLTVAGQAFQNIYSYFSYVYDGGGFRLYNNSTLVGTLSGAITLPTSSGTALISTTGEYFEGNVYCVHLYNRGLSAGEILKNWNTIKIRLGG